jgi:hypothetical protein
MSERLIMFWVVLSFFIQCLGLWIIMSKIDDTNKILAEFRMEDLRKRIAELTKDKP